MERINNVSTDEAHKWLTNIKNVQWSMGGFDERVKNDHITITLPSHLTIGLDLLGINPSCLC